MKKLFTSIPFYTGLACGSLLMTIYYSEIQFSLKNEISSGISAVIFALVASTLRVLKEIKYLRFQQSRILLDETDFRDLVNGEVVSLGITNFSLADIGTDKMRQIIDERILNDAFDFRENKN